MKFKIDDNFNTIINELTESLIFSKMHQYIYFNLQQFTAENETEIKTKITSIKNDFSFSQYKLEPIYNECKFKLAVNEIKKLTTVMVPFEKLVKLY
jgi:hypothetical protein